MCEAAMVKSLGTSVRQRNPEKGFLPGGSESAIRKCQNHNG